MKKILIIIPSYNEEKNIGKFLEDIIAIKKENENILVVDDGSSDNTAEIVKQYDCRYIRQIYNCGYGNALQLGYKYAVKYDYDYIIQMDADGQHKAENLYAIRQAIADDDFDILLGSRFLKKSKSFNVGFLKRRVIRFFESIIYLFSKTVITDPTSGLQCLNKRAFSYYAEYNNFDSMYPDMNIIIQMTYNGYKIKEFPAYMVDRNVGVSMHSGIIKPFKYMIIITIATISVFIRKKNDK